MELGHPGLEVKETGGARLLRMGSKESEGPQEAGRGKSPPKV